MQLEIGLLHGLEVAKSVSTEPVSPDDWEILVNGTLISYSVSKTLFRNFMPAMLKTTFCLKSALLV